MPGHRYDVFLSHHSDDAPQAEALAHRLKAAGIRPFIKAWHLIPGGSTQKDVEDALEASRTYAVIVGSAGLESWAEQERLVAQRRQVENPNFRVIPVLLSETSELLLPPLLREKTPVELTDLKDETAFSRLIAGIRGEAPLPPLLDGSRRTARSQDDLPPNPFGDQGRITDPARFFDREEILDQVFAELAAGRNLSLVGEAQIGKSSALAQICHRGPQRLGRPVADFVDLDMQTLGGDEDFFEALGEKLGLPGFQGWKLKRALGKRRVVLCLDDIEKMAYSGFTREVRAQLRGLADGGQAPLTLVVASRAPLADLFPDSPGETSPLAPICQPHSLGPFSAEVCRSFLRQRLASVGRRFENDEEARLIVESGGHPGKLQALSYDSYSSTTRTAKI